MNLTHQTTSPQFKLAMGDRPLQNSMVSLKNQSLSFSPRNRIQLGEGQQPSYLRRSQVSSPPDSLNNPLSQSQATLAFSFRTTSLPFNRENMRVNTDAALASPLPRQVYSPKLVSRSFINPESDTKIGSNANASFNLKKASFQQDAMVKEVINLIKKEHLGPLVQELKEEFLNSLSSIHEEFTNFKNEIRGTLKHHQNSILQLTISQNLKGTTTKNSFEDRKREVDSLLQTEFYLLKTKVQQLEVQFTQKMMIQDEQIELLSSSLPSKGNISKTLFKSMLPSLLLECKQSFTIKSKKGSQEFLLSNSLYYIDRKGFLMDSDNYYLLDGQGNQIRLQEQHLKMLKIENLVGQESYL